MDSSPLSLPGTPRTFSPTPSDDDLNGSGSPSPGDARISAAMEGSGGDVGSAGSGSEAYMKTAQQPPPEAHPKVPKGKEKARKGPLRLLDLPVDILKEIIHQLPHTNDLTSLALCHSALHRLAIPCIYSRFDIVWPDENTHTEPRTGVDALTYGLATLVMAEDTFPHQHRYRKPSDNSLAPCQSQKSAATPYPVPRRRLGNYYAQFTKKFSLGNGPAAWVQEYMISKEGGKMLGTLVALAVARMVNLETFVWDMPTGVLRDVWLALSSLADRTDGDECRLDRLWIRFHDNTLDAPAPAPPPPMILNNVPAPPNTTHTSGVGLVQAPVVVSMNYPSPTASVIDRVEHPTFSVIPPLKSLSVLDVDELPYLDEMSILIARSQRKLRELRVGIAAHAQQRDWVTAWEGDGIQQVDYSTTWPGATAIGEKRLGGVLGILVGRVFNIRQNGNSSKPVFNAAGPTSGYANPASMKIDTQGVVSTLAPTPQQDRDPEYISDTLNGILDEPGVPEGVSLLGHIQPHNNDHVAQPGPGSPSEPSNQNNHNLKAPPLNTPRTPLPCSGCTNCRGQSEETILNGKLRLETLELERVPLSVSVLMRAIDWPLLTTLTLLNCNNHEQLWKSLRRTYSPRPSYPTGSPSSSSKAYKASYTLRSEYGLNLKKIHTNTVSPSLISFLKETLAPNSLETLFLQEGRSYSSTVTVDAIYRGPLRRHRSSLKKLMIDSSERGPDGHATTSSRWRRWMLNHDIITFITSGRMNSLRELAVSLDYRDWHYFLRRLPLIPHVRSLYIPFIADHVHGNNIDPRELAMQILDIVHLRPEVALVYCGILHKCYEILENRPSNYDLRHDEINEDGGTGGYATNDQLMSDEESDATEDEEDDDLDGGMGPAADGDDTNSDASDDPHDDSDGDESFVHDTQKGPKLRIREILFYDERCEIFRVRFGFLKP
ncbi:F-box domain-containing protein [Lojkania enalia]|uniref:F-box domain-containing protein n=1 Tax=Lojkania enalia TaxID=147567 RepID=A0A9P4KJ11_9PLEO|nr:F-box domain-containing protein [Didymosphaeria enalia]